MTRSLSLRLFVLLLALVPSAVESGPKETIVARWYENGRLESVRRYAGGVKVGHHRGWWPDGTPLFEADYKDNAFHGVYRAWFESGRLSDERTYFEGHEKGFQRGWTADGTLFFNYEVRDGRRYGLVNAKPCIPAGRATS